jgi:hypothetical protein
MEQPFVERSATDDDVALLNGSTGVLIGTPIRPKRSTSETSEEPEPPAQPDAHDS